jgi:hypothetical protein
MKKSFSSREEAFAALKKQLTDLREKHGKEWCLKSMPLVDVQSEWDEEQHSCLEASFPGHVDSGWAKKMEDAVMLTDSNDNPMTTVRVWLSGGGVAKKAKRQTQDISFVKKEPSYKFFNMSESDEEPSKEEGASAAAASK